MKLLPHWRPATRGDCSDVDRPCIYVACKQNLFLDVLEPSSASPLGTIKLNFARPDEMPPAASCALDVADRGPHTLEEVAAIMNMSDERVRQIDIEAREKFQRKGADGLRNIAEQTEVVAMAAKKKTSPKNGKAFTPPKGAVQRGKPYKEKLPVPLDEQAVATKASELAVVIRHREGVLEERREQMAEFREQLSHFDAQLKELAASVESHTESRDVLCTDWLLPNNEMLTVRSDTGEVVEKRAATGEELQEKLIDDPDGDEDEEPEDKGPADDVILAEQLRGKQHGARDARPGDGG